VHYPSDVLAGFTIGTAAAALTVRWWPLRPARPAEAVRPRTEAPATLTGEGLVLVVNESAGRASRALTARLRAQLPEATILEMGAGQDLSELLRAGALKVGPGDATILGVAGGDGTISAAAGVALELGLPLLVIPSGTFNHFAADLGIKSPDAALAALRTGDAVLVDVGVAGGRSFVNTASIGVYVDLVQARRRLESRVGKWAAVIIALVQVLRDGHPDDVVIDGHHGRLWLLFAGNCRYEPPGFAPSYRPRLSDGQLDLRVIFATVPFGRSRLVASVLTGTLARSRVYRAWTASAVEITAADGTPLWFARDGELSEATTSLQLAKRPRQLLVYRRADV
jgi:undecaprenyl-diphosphatase